MNRKSTLLLFLWIIPVGVFTLNCSNSDKNPSPTGDLKGTFKGTATNKANTADKKALTMSITNSDNPIAGTYTLVGGTINVTGKLSGSVLGSILNLSLKPDASGTTYTFSGSANADDTVLSGTMTGVESTTTVIYDVSVNK